MPQKLVMYHNAVYRLIQATETEDFKTARNRYRKLTKEQREVVSKLMEVSSEVQSIEKQLLELVDQQNQMKNIVSEDNIEVVKAEAANAIKTLDKIELLQKRYFEILGDFVYKAEQTATTKKEGSTQNVDLISRIEELLGMDCEIIQDEPATDGQLTQQHPAGAESPNATLYPIPLKPQHRANAERRKVAMAKDPVIPDDMVKHDQKSENVETSGKGESKEDKGWENVVEKNVEKIAEKGSEKTAMPTYLMYKGRRYAKVEK